MTDETTPNPDAYPGDRPGDSDQSPTDPDETSKATVTDSANAADAARSATEDDKPWGDEPYMVWRNRSVVGELTVHYPERDVAFPCDGEAALRAMRLFARPGTTGLEDHLDDLSNALHIWLTFDRVKPLAMSWLPIEPRSSKAVIDPDPSGMRVA